MLKKRGKPTRKRAWERGAGPGKLSAAEIRAQLQKLSVEELEVRADDWVRDASGPADPDTTFNGAQTTPGGGQRRGRFGDTGGTQRRTTAAVGRDSTVSFSGESVAGQGDYHRPGSEPSSISKVG